MVTANVSHSLPIFAIFNGGFKQVTAETGDSEYVYIIIYIIVYSIYIMSIYIYTLIYHDMI